MALKGQGVTHVVLSESDYGRFLLPSLRPRKGAEEAYALNRRFYQAVRNASKPLWSRARDRVIYLHPGLEVLALPAGVGPVKDGQTPATDRF